MEWTPPPQRHPSARLLCTDDNGGRSTYTETCYSGKGPGLNDPASQCQPNVGPIPAGWYGIGNRYSGGRTDLRNPLPLAPDPNNNMCNRSGFLIHGDNSRGDNSASEGCIICSPGLGQRIKDGGGGNLFVHQ